MNYIAYTVGPIYETIFNTLNGKNKTKKLYAGSYFFSYFMKTLLISIHKEFDILVPYVANEALTKEHKMGLFHDRFIAQSVKTKDEIKEIFISALEGTFKILAKEIKDESISSDLKENMNNHFIIAQDKELQEIDSNIIFALNKILDSKELQREFFFDTKINYIQLFQENFVQKSTKRVKTLEEISDEFGYYAVITADGDKVGKKIKEEATQNPENIKTLSQNLYNFFTNGNDIFEITNNEFGGELIYAGGDDILAFLPVKKEDKTFLDYINLLDKRFKTLVSEDVSLSFGVNIVYNKYPLRNAINGAFELLHKAKKSTVNVLAIKTTKHSGQYFDTRLSLGSEDYRLYKKLINGILHKEISLPHSFHHSLRRYEEAILSIFTNENTSLDAMFSNVFNDIKDDKDEKGLSYVKELMASKQPKNSGEFNQVFSQLSLVKFLREDRV